MTSDRCIESEFWDVSKHSCEPCETKYNITAGFEFSANCGWSDDQYKAKPAYTKCGEGTFNDGSQTFCRDCRRCPTSEFIACSTTSDTVCCIQGEQILDGKCVPRRTLTKTTTRLTENPTFPTTSSVASSSPLSTKRSTQISPHSTKAIPQINSQTSHHTSLTGIYISLALLSALSILCLFLVVRRRRIKCWNKEFRKNNSIRESLSRKSIDRFQQSVSYNIIKENGITDHMTGPSLLIAPEVQNAPLKTVLNNLDVLEELVQLLDPDISGAKNTRHLAAQCSFSFAWINYAYSMKDRKSPLVAVLEGVVTKNPEWTVGHFAQLLSAIGRNDAAMILAKLPVDAKE